MNAVMPSGKTYIEEMDANEEGMILRDVEGMASSIPAMQGQARLERLESEYIDAYWQRFDPVFSVIHRPTFEVHGTSPLVRSLMIAIGAQYFDNEAAQTMARTLRESCAKLMQRVRLCPSAVDCAKRLTVLYYYSVRLLITVIRGYGTCKPCCYMKSLHSSVHDGQAAASRSGLKTS